MGKRRTRGEGGLTQRKDGLWVASISCGQDESGKRLRRVAYGQTKQEALSALRDLRKEVDAGVVRTTKDTVGSFLETWLESIVGNLRPGSARNYRGVLDHYLIPGLGQTELSRLSPLQVQMWLKKMQDDGKSATVRRLAFDVLNRAMARAVGWQLIARNPVEGVEAPVPSKAKMKVWDEEQVRTFLEATVDDDLHTMWVLACYTGMREGELIGLRWDFVDLVNGTLTVTEQVTLTGGEGGYRRVTGSAPKTEAAVRTFSLSSAEVTALRRQRERLMAEGLAACPFVFPVKQGRNRGQPLYDSHVRRRFHAAREKAGLPHIRFHDMRHTNATVLIANGVDPKTVQGRLGHATINVTMNTYAKFTKAGDQKAAATLAGVFAKKA